MSAHRIAISTHKGGAGKTVTAMALGAALARKGKRCLLVDLDPQGHCALGLGIDLQDGHPTMNEFFQQFPSRALHDVIQPTHLETLDIAPSDNRLAWTAETLTARPKKEHCLERGLKPLLEAYDWMLFDCPPSLGVLTQNALNAADFVIIPCELGARAADALVELLELAQLVKDDDAFDKYGILLTKVDTRKTVTLEAVKAALSTWAHKIFTTTIPQSEPLNQAQIQGTDVFSFQPKSKGALAYQAFTEELMNHGKKENQ